MTDAEPAVPTSSDGLPEILRRTQTGPLATQVRHGIAWTAASRLVVQVVQVGATAVLARLLSPADYGLSALVVVVTGFAAILVDLGIPSAVIQRRDIDARYLSTAFWLNFAVGVVMAGLVCAVAVPVARFFDEPQLVQLMMLASITFVLSLNAVHVAVLQRALAFPLLSRMSVVTTVVGLAVSVGAAAAGMGAVSLILGPIAERVTSVIQTWVAVRWVPTVRPSREGAQAVWSFGRGLTGTKILNYWVGSADRFVIGRLVSVADLGYYNRAWNLMMLPIQQNGRVLASVFYPALAKIAHDPPRLQAAWLRLIRASWITGVPMGLGLVLTAPSLVATLYGPTWDPVVPLLVALSASVPLLLLNTNFGPTFQALGRTGLQFRLELVSAALSLAALAIGVQWGVLGVAVAYAVRTAVTVSIALIVLLRLLELPLGRFLRTLWRAAAAGLAMAAAVWLVARSTTEVPTPLALGLQAATGVLVYGVFIWWLERDTLRELLGARGKRLFVRRRRRG